MGYTVKGVSITPFTLFILENLKRIYKYVYENKK